MTRTCAATHSPTPPQPRSRGRCCSRCRLRPCRPATPAARPASRLALSRAARAEGKLLFKGELSPVSTARSVVRILPAGEGHAWRFGAKPAVRRPGQFSSVLLYTLSYPPYNPS
jgi:hypothetical protein